MMAAPRPRPATTPGLLDDEDPGKWDRVKQALWETNLNAPIRGIYSLMNTDPYTLYTDTGAAGQQAVADSFDAAGGVTVGSMPIPKPSNSLTMGIKAYHGSPHSFDKFSMDKIGTGEGAQAYGHGLYFAENEDIARHYRDALSNDPTVTINTDEGPKKFISTNEGFMDNEGNFINEFYPGGQIAAKAATTYDTPLGWKQIIRRQAKNDAEAVSAMQLLRKKNVVKTDPGSMYEVNIDADPNAFLDWDKPLSEQPKQVQEALAAMDPDMYAPGGGDYDPSELGQITYQRLAAQKRDYGIDSGRNNLTTLGGAQAGATDDLKGFGIPGIKYLDAGSRGKGVMHVQPMYKGQPYGDPIPAHAWNQVEQLTQRYKDMGYDVEIKDLGTRNYVVFDDRLVNIIKKYGLAGLLGGGAAANELMSQPQEQY